MREELGEPPVGRFDEEVRVATVGEELAGRAKRDVSKEELAGKPGKVGEDGIEAGRLNVLQRVEGDNQCCWTRLRRKLGNEGVVLLDRKRN